MTRPDDTVSLRVTEPREVPALSLVLGYGPMLPFVGGAALAWICPDPWRMVLFNLVVFWAVAICTFLAGVRRGVSFRTVGGPTVSQIATMMWLFCAGLGSLVLWSFGEARWSLPLLAVAFFSIGILDPIAARKGEAPLFFAKLRPPQMILPVVGLLALWPLAPHG